MQIGRSNLCFYKELLLQGLLNSNSHANGHTDHGGAIRPPPGAEEGRGASGSGRQETSLL